MNETAVGRWLVVAAAVIVVATIIAAIAVMGLPSTQREVGLDQRRVRDLERIVAAVDDYVERHDALPPDLGTLASQPGLRLAITDPVDGSRYVYEVSGDRRFRLCAEFATDTAETTEAGTGAIRDQWLHAAGRHCFERSPRNKRRQD